MKKEEQYVTHIIVQLDHVVIVLECGLVYRSAFYPCKSR